MKDPQDTACETIRSAASNLARVDSAMRAWGKNEPLRHWPDESLMPDAARHFAGTVLVLTGARTYSAAEDFVVAFRTSGRGQIVGAATGGSTGQPLSFSLPGGGSARVCTKHDAFPNGNEFVGVGVIPDVEAHRTRQDVIAGTDPVLDRALSIAAAVSLLEPDVSRMRLYGMRVVLRG